MSYHHLNTFECTRIEVLSKMGYLTRQIAQQLNHHHSTIARELKWNTQKAYQAESADELAGGTSLSLSSSRDEIWRSHSNHPTLFKTNLVAWTNF